MKKYRKFYLFLLVLSVIATPILINIGLFLNIPTQSTTDADWLSFWGSFLGGIFGGLATLFAVTLTINQMESERKEKKLTDNPQIIFLRDTYEITQTSNGKYILDFSQTTQHNTEISKDSTTYNNYEPMFYIVNIGKELAKSVSFTWNKPNLNLINSNYPFKFMHQDVYSSIENIGIDNRTMLRNNIQIIRGYESNEVRGIYLYPEIENWISVLTTHVREEIFNINELEFGTINVSYTNIFGYKHQDAFRIVGRVYGGCQGGTISDCKDAYFLDIDFYKETDN